MFKFYRDVVILFAIFFAYLMMAGGTTPIEGACSADERTREFAREMMAEQKQAKEELQQKE